MCLKRSIPSLGMGMKRSYAKLIIPFSSKILLSLYLEFRVLGGEGGGGGGGWLGFT